MNNYKNDLEVHELSLARIAKNLHKIPRKGKIMEGFGQDEIKKLTPQQKQQLQEKIANFNKYGEVLRCETAIKELAKNLEEITTMAETYAMSEASDYFQQEVIGRDYKQMKGITKDFNKLAQECYGKLMQLNALYEDSGKLLERYFEIKSLDEIAKQNEIVGDEIQSTIPKDEVKPQDIPNSGEEQDEYASGF